MPAATSACPRRPSTIASASASVPRPTGCIDRGTLPDGAPVPRLPLRFDLVVVEPGDRSDITGMRCKGVEFAHGPLHARLLPA